jgi:hypothetical protein
MEVELQVKVILEATVLFCVKAAVAVAQAQLAVKEHLVQEIQLDTVETDVQFLFQVPQ